MHNACPGNFRRKEPALHDAHDSSPGFEQLQYTAGFPSSCGGRSVLRGRHWSDRYNANNSGEESAFMSRTLGRVECRDQGIHLAPVAAVPPEHVHFPATDQMQVNRFV